MPPALQLSAVVTLAARTPSSTTSATAARSSGDGPPFATPKTFEVLGTCPVRWHPDDVEWYEKWEIDRTGAACLGLYTNGGTVFTAAITDWSHGLQGNDAHVVRITKNVLERLGKN